MAQTKRRRRSKHRGTAAGSVVSRGRTGRKPTAAESKRSTREEARERRMQRYDRRPTWKSAAQRGAIATVLFFVLSVALLHQPLAPAIGISLFVLVLYSGIGYTIDSALYTRRQRKKAREAEAAREARSKGKSG